MTVATSPNGRTTVVPAAPALPRLFGEDPGLLGGIALAASQTAVLTAVLYYFGWARTNATLGVFGLDPSIVGYETTDYVLRSITVAFPTAVGAAGIGITLLVVHRTVLRSALRGPRRGRARRAARVAVLGLHLLAAAVPGVLLAAAIRPDPVAARLGIGVPLLIVGLTVLLAYLGHLRRNFPHDVPGPRTPSGGSSRGATVLLATLGLLGAFWAAGLQADAAGRRIAGDIVRDLATRRVVVLFSDETLRITGSGVEVVDLGPGRFRYRYTGVRMLARSGEALLLLPAGWREGGPDRVFVVPDDGTVRYDVG